MTCRGLMVLVGLLLPCVGALAETRLAVYFDAESARVGEPTRLVVELSTDSWFRRTVPLPTVSIEGAVVLTPEGFASSFTERREGVTYAIVRRELLVIAQRAGALQVPPITVQAWVAQAGGNAPEAQRLSSEAVVLSVVDVPGAIPGTVPLVANNLRLTETYSEQAKEFEVGAGLTRKIRVQLEGNSAMFVEPLRLPVPEGVRQYLDRPRLDERTQRGQIQSERIEILTYLFEQSGDVLLPAVRVKWWNPDTGTLELAELPERRLRVGDNAAVGEQGVSGWPLATGIVLGLVAGVFAVRRWRRGASEEARSFKVLQNACRRSDEAAQLAALYSWLDLLVGRPVLLKQAAAEEVAIERSLDSRLKRLFSGIAKAEKPERLSGLSLRRWRRRLKEGQFNETLSSVPSGREAATDKPALRGHPVIGTRKGK